MVGELFCRSAKVQLIHVPYKSTPINDAMAGTIDSFFVSPSLIMQYLQAGKLRMLGISSAKRMPQLPDVPTFGEYGIEADIPGWSGFWGPPKLPPAVVDSLYKTLPKGAREKSFETYTRDNGAEIVGLPPPEFAAYVASEIERYSKRAAAARHPGRLSSLVDSASSGRMPRRMATSERFTFGHETGCVMSELRSPDLAWRPWRGRAATPARHRPPSRRDPARRAQPHKAARERRPRSAAPIAAGHVGGRIGDLGADQEARQPRRAVGALLEAQKLRRAQPEQRRGQRRRRRQRRRQALAERLAVRRRRTAASTAWVRMLCCAITENSSPVM